MSQETLELDDGEVSVGKNLSHAGEAIIRLTVTAPYRATVSMTAAEALKVAGWLNDQAFAFREECHGSAVPCAEAKQCQDGWPFPADGSR